MPDGTIKSKTGNASIKKQGQTMAAGGQFGTNPNAKTKGRGPAQDLSK